MMTREVSGLVALVCLFASAPASAGQIVRTVSAGRETVTIIDHGRTRGRPALHGRPVTRSSAATEAAAAPRTVDAAAADDATTRRPAPALDVMATQTVTAMLALQVRSNGDSSETPAVGTDPTAHELRVVGAVPNDAAREAVVQRAFELAGVETLHNELRVFDWEPSPYLVFDDAHVRERVRLALLAWPELHGADIDVDVVRGVTTLTGSVATADQRVRASTAAASAPGVYLVQNRLGLLPD